jgi:hypothetical protein
LDPREEIKKNLKKELDAKYLLEEEDLRKKDNHLNRMMMKINMYLLLETLSKKKKKLEKRKNTGKLTFFLL